MYNKDHVNKIIDKNICIISRYSQGYADERLKKFQLNKTQAEIVLFIYENDNLSLAQINRYFLFNKATITKNIKYLIQLELVSWNSVKSDKRKKMMVITDKGRELVPEIINVLRQWDNNLTLALNKEETELLSELLYTITKLITKNEEY
jgi:DNA-binding MarR family transcriptional regulator